MIFRKRIHRVPAWLLLFGVSVSSKCKGFALEKSNPLLQPLQGSFIFQNGHRRPTLRAPHVLRSLERIGVNIRGGAIDSKRLRGEANDDSMEDNAAPQDLRRRRGMGAALGATYFAVMASKCALPAVLDQLTSPKIGLHFSSSWTAKPQLLFGRLLALSTVAIAAGKLLLGPVIDSLGGILSLKISLTLLALLLGAISVTNSFTVFAISWMFVDFIFSSCWAACINAIHQVFPEREWAKQIGMLAAAARTGNATAFAFFAWVLAFVSDRISQPWRVVFVASSLVQVLPFALLTYFGEEMVSTASTSSGRKKSKEEFNNQLEDATPKWKTSIATLQREAKTPTFWLHFISRSALMVFASFLLFVPLLMSQAYGVSSSAAAQVGSVYALGCLLSVTLGSSFYARLSKNRRALSVAILLAMSTLSSAAQWGHMAGTWTMSPEASAASMFFWGFSFAIPFYIPPSLYALSKGGVKSSATIADGKCAITENDYLAYA